MKGRKPKPPHLRAVPDAAAKGAPIAPGAPAEPDWRDWFPVTSGPHAAANKRCREVARSEWRRVVAILAAAGVLSPLDRGVLAEHSICAARIDQLERIISREGTTVTGTRGSPVRNPVLAVLNQYRGHLKFTITEMGLSPVSRGRVRGGGPAQGDELWD